MEKEKYSIYLDTPEQDWFGDFDNKWEAMASFNNLDSRCGKDCIGKDKVLYHGEDEIARATIQNLTIFE